MDINKYIFMIKQKAINNGKKRYFYVHIWPVVLQSRLLARKYGASENICTLAALFHDIGRIDKVQEHGTYGAKIAEGILEGEDISKNDIAEVVFAIKNHDKIDNTYSLDIVSKILRSADGIAQIKFPFFAWGEQEYMKKMGFDALRSFNLEKIEKAFNKIAFEEERQMLLPLYEKRKSIFIAAKQNNTEFCLFTVPHMYNKVSWEVTQRCNITCKHCCNGDPKIEKLPSLEDYKKAIDSLKESAFDEIYFTGGEPFIIPYFIDVLDYAHQAGMLCGVATNATLLTIDITNRMADMGLNMLQVSLDGPDEESNDLIRGRGSFKHAIDGIKKVHDIYKVRMSSVVLKHTQNRLEEFVQLALSLRMNELILNWPRKVGRLVTNSDMYPTITEADFFSAYKKLAEKYKDKIKITTHIYLNSINEISKCEGGQKIIFIDRNGKVAPCSWINKGFPEFISKASIYKEGFLECQTELNEFVELINKREESGYKGCPFIAFQNYGKFMAQDPRLK